MVKAPRLSSLVAVASLVTAAIGWWQALTPDPVLEHLVESNRACVAKLMELVE